MNALLEGVSAQVVEYMDIREEFELHDFLTQLEKLHSAASSEWNLRGPFPDVAYGRILKGTQSMLDAFHAMNVVISKDPASKGEIEILRYTSSERDHLCARISHLLQVLASSMKLEYPLNEALPNTEHARDRLLAKIFKYRKEKPGAKDEDFGHYCMLMRLLLDSYRHKSLKSAERLRSFLVFSMKIDSSCNSSLLPCLAGICPDVEQASVC